MCLIPFRALYNECSASASTLLYTINNKAAFNSVEIDMDY